MIVNSGLLALERHWTVLGNDMVETLVRHTAKSRNTVTTSRVRASYFHPEYSSPSFADSSMLREEFELAVCLGFVSKILASWGLS